MVKWVLKINQIIVKAEEIVLILSILTMAIILIMNVLCRLFLHFSFSFAEEVGQIMIVLVTFIGISYVATKGKHISMMAVFERMPAALRKVTAIFIAAVTGFTMFVLSYVGFNYMQLMMKTGKVTASLQIPMYLVAMMVAIGFLCAGIQYLLVVLLNLIHKEVYIGVEHSYVMESVVEAPAKQSDSLQ